MDRAVEVIEEVAPVLKNGTLVIILGKLVIDVVKADRLGIQPVLHTADPVASHLLIGDRLLCGNTILFCFLLRYALFPGRLTRVLSGNCSCACAGSR